MRYRISRATLPAIALATAMWIATPAVAATLVITPNPLIDPLPVTAVISGAGYLVGGGNADIFASPAGGPAMNIKVATCAVDGAGNLVSVTSTVDPCIMVAGPNSATGTYDMTATQGSSTTPIGGVVVLSANGVPFPIPTMSLSPNPFSAGETVTLSGCGWQIMGNVNSLDIYLANAAIGPGAVSLAASVPVSVAVGSSCTYGGSWSATFVIPTSLATGTYYMNAYRAGNSGAQSALVQASTSYSLSWTQPSSAAEAVAGNPSYTG